VEPNEDVLRAEIHSLRVLTKGPYYKFNLDLFASLKALGFPASARLISITSIAGRARTAFSSRVFQHCMDLIASAKDSYEAALVPLGGRWLENSILFGLHRAMLRSQLDEPQVSMQKRLYAALERNRPQFSLCKLLTTRHSSWLQSGEREAAAKFAREGVEFLAACAGKAPPSLLMTLLRTLLDAWTTANNFGHGLRACTFCGHDSGDNCFHFSDCCELRGAYDDVPGIAPLVSFHWCFIPDVCDHDSLLRALVHIHCVYSCFNHCKHGIPFNRRMYWSFIDKAMRDSNTMRSAMMNV